MIDNDPSVYLHVIKITSLFSPTQGHGSSMSGGITPVRRKKQIRKQKKANK